MLKIVDCFFAGLLGFFQLLYLARSLLDRKIFLGKKNMFFVVMVVSIFYTFIFLKFEDTVKTLMIVFVNTILCIKLYNVSLLKSIFLNLVYIVILLLPELIVLFCLVELFGMSKEFCYNVFAGSFLGDLTIFILFIVLVFLLRKPLRKLFETQIDTNIKIIIFSFLSFLCVLMFFYTFIDKFSFSNDVFLYLFFILVLVLMLSNFIKQMIENKKLSIKYDKLLEFMTTYEEEIENQRILRHEIKNEFLVVKAKLVDSQKNDEIVCYIDEILKDKIIVKYEQYARLGYLPPNGIKGLCYFKVQEAENLGLDVSINISKKVRNFDINKLSISEQRNLARILGVFLDNAKEASNTSIEKKLGLEVYCNNNDSLKFIVSNTFNNIIDEEKIGRVRFSTKGSDRGHGLMLVNYIIENSKVFDFKTEIRNNIYIQTLTIKNKNK